MHIHVGLYLTERLKLLPDIVHSWNNLTYLDLAG